MNRRGAAVKRALLAMALVLTGCALPAQPLSRFDTGGREKALVDADKLACWQEAMAANPATWGEVGPRIAGALILGLPGALIGDAFTKEERAAHDQRIEQTAEACMTARGYTIKPK